MSAGARNARTPSARPYRVGLISDTHGKLSFAAEQALAGSDEIIHAGDLGPGILMRLEALAYPVTAVRGNTDHDPVSRDLPVLANREIAGVRVLVIHDHTHVGAVPPDVDVVVYGHTHRPDIAERDDALWVNPGSPSRSRGDGHTVGYLDIADGRASARIVELD